jgi:hypothetical protein
MGEAASSSLTLDYTLVTKDVKSIATRILPTDFNDALFNPRALSDHMILISDIYLS